MNIRQEINWCFQGQGYNQFIEITDRFGTTLYLDNCDNFITSKYGEVHMNLSCDGKNTYPYILRIFEDQVLIMPSIYLLSKNLIYFNGSFQTYIVSRDILKHLWNDMRYDSMEIDTLSNANEDDLMLFWFAGIKKVSLDCPVKEIAKWLTKIIVAEDISGCSQALKIIELYINNNIILDNHLLSCTDNSKTITTYIDNNESVIEWSSLDAFNRNQIVMKDQWRLNVINA